MAKRGMKRLHPARYSATYVSTPRIDANKAAAYNKQRSKATLGGRYDTQPNPDNNFMQEVPRTISLTTVDWELVDGNTGEKLNRREKKRVIITRRDKSKRKEVVDRKAEIIAMEEHRKRGTFLLFYKVWEGWNRQGVQEFHVQTLKENKEKGFSQRLYFCGNEAIIVQESKSGRFISKVYIGRDTALEHYNNNKIQWIKREVSNSSE